MLTIRFQKDTNGENEMNVFTYWLNRNAIYWTYGKEQNTIEIDNMVWYGIKPKGKYLTEIDLVQDTRTEAIIVIRTECIDCISFC